MFQRKRRYFIFLDLQIFTIGFVANNYELHLLLRVLLNLFKPKVLEVFEGDFVFEIKNKDDAIGTFVVCWSNGAKTLLACSIPYLHLDSTIIKLESSESKSFYLNLKSTPIVAR